ncbi:MAG: dihydrofolate reductase family protein [Candidatus Uhrbacteria bacterium]|nr:dihydrofolate reductase family protein [Candidatus Uhrbacteria bacterium]
MIMSLDGKISSGDSDKLDTDRDWQHIRGVKEGLWQYYNLEKVTDNCSLITGRTLAKIGFNKKKEKPHRIPVTSVIIDNKPHLKKSGVKFLSNKFKRVIVVTTNSRHPAIGASDNVEVIQYKTKIDFVDLFEKLKSKFKINRITIQSGGTLNSILLRAGLIDQLSIVIAPLLVGGSTTSTLIDGEAIHYVSELAKLKALKLKSSIVLKNSYLHLRYNVINATKIN